MSHLNAILRTHWLRDFRIHGTSAMAQTLLSQFNLVHVPTAAVMSDGRILIGTNNEYPQDPSIDGMGVMMCFSDKDGSFLWQIVHDALAAAGFGTGRNKAYAQHRIEGDRFYYIKSL